ncbi:MAG: HAMP domain-containing histidine kinase [Pseudoflavonifractor sp.]|nr:HAMP domain-containing histidine kinase [Pseudoflavonifractor sp.]
MKRFRIVTVLSLAAIAMMVVANAVCLHGLYRSIERQTMQGVTECLRRADILEIISRMRDTRNGSDDSFIRLTLMVEGERASDGSYRYPNLLENMEQTMSGYFHLIADMTPEMPGRDTRRLEQIYRRELSSAGFYPKEVVIADSVSAVVNPGGYWEVSVNGSDGSPAVRGYISPLTGYIFNRMAGIVVTSAAILILMSFLIWYLLHWVGKLRSIEQMKDDFTHNMTHELKTPVAVAYSAADSMLRYYDQSDEKRNRRLLSIIMQRLSFLSGMIENILSMSMERFKTMRLNVERVTIRPLVEEVAGMIEMKTDRPMTVEIDVDDDAVVSTDALHFGNLLSNLLDNAVKYSRDTVWVRIAGDSNGIAVSDKGIGIAKDKLPHIFDKFYRVTDGDRYEVGGYGLGLYYVKQIVDMQGWSIAVVSEPGVGTTFTINFDADEKR